MEEQDRSMRSSVRPDSDPSSLERAKTDEWCATRNNPVGPWPAILYRRDGQRSFVLCDEHGRKLIPSDDAKKLVVVSLTEDQ